MIEKHEKALEQLTQQLGMNKTTNQVACDEIKEIIENIEKRVSSVTEDTENIQRDWKAQIPLLVNRSTANESKVLQLEREFKSLSDRLPPNVDILMQTLNILQEQVRNKSSSDEKRFKILELDNQMLKKKFNIAELEHRMMDRIDDIVRVLKAQCADKDEVTKRWRILESRLECNLDIVVMLLREDVDQLRSIVQKIPTNSKKLKNAKFFSEHLKKRLEFEKKRDN